MGQQTLVAYGATWKYLQGAHGHSAGFQATAFDDSAWSSGQAAFGSAGGCPYSFATGWTIDTDMCLRIHVTVPGATTAIQLTYGIDNDATVYWNGTQIQAVTHSGCATTTDQTVAVPSWTTGDNVLAVRAADFGFQSFFALTAVATRPDPAPGFWIDFDRD